MNTNAIALLHKGVVANMASLDAALAKGAANRPNVAAGGKPFLRLSSEGDGWLYGADNVEVEEGSKWAVNPFTLRSGWVCWADPKKNGNKREKLGDVMGSITSPPACPSVDHSAKGGSWQEQFGFDLICISGEDTGTEVAYNVNSYGGKKAFDVIYEALATRPSPEHCFPIVLLEQDSYKNKAYGKTVWTPELNIVDWADSGQNMLTEAGPAPAQVENKTSEAGAPASTQPAPEAAQAPANEAEAPVRRRRRAAAA